MKSGDRKQILQELRNKRKLKLHVILGKIGLAIQSVREEIEGRESSYELKKELLLWEELHDDYLSRAKVGEQLNAAKKLKLTPSSIRELEGTIKKYSNWITEKLNALAVLHKLEAAHAL